MTVSDEELMAYADNALTGADRARVAEAVMQDPDLRARLDAFERSALVARDAMPLVDVPEALKQRVEATISASEVAGAADGSGAGVVRAGRTTWIGAVAASVLLGIGLGAFLLNPNEEASVAFDLSPVVPTLETAASGTSIARHGIDTRLIASFVAADGAFCREFEAKLADKSDLIGVGCRTATGWELRFAAATELPGDTQFVPASAFETLEMWMRSTHAGPLMSVEEEAQRLSGLNG